MEDDCLRLEDGTVLVFFKETTSWEDNAVVVDGRRYEVGSSITLGGGYNEDGLTAIPQQCGDGSVFFVSSVVQTSKGSR